MSKPKNNSPSVDTNLPRAVSNDSIPQQDTELENRCNDCNFKRYLKKSHRTLKMWRIEQIVKDSYIDLCTYHTAFYWLKRFKWWLNLKSGYRLEGASKWWIR